MPLSLLIASYFVSKTAQLGVQAKAETKVSAFFVISGR